MTKTPPNFSQAPLSALLDLCLDLGPSLLGLHSLVLARILLSQLVYQEFPSPLSVSS